MATITVELPFNNSIRINKEGRIDHKAEHAFTRGQCHALATHRLFPHRRRSSKSL